MKRGREEERTRGETKEQKKKREPDSLDWKQKSDMRVKKKKKETKWKTWHCVQLQQSEKRENETRKETAQIRVWSEPQWRGGGGRKTIIHKNPQRETFIKKNKNISVKGWHLQIFYVQKVIFKDTWIIFLQQLSVNPQSSAYTVCIY